jgi:hypothetical protein
MQDILSAIPGLLNSQSDSEELRRPVIFAVWRRIAGDALAGHAVPYSLEGSKLIIAAADRNWQRNIEQLAGEMIFKMNYIFGEPQVKRIEFVINKEAVEANAKTPVDHAVLEAEALDEIGEPLRKAADVIENDDLRRKFLLAAGSCLARERRMAAK